MAGPCDMSLDGGSAVIGIDIGTSAVKVGLYDADGTEHVVVGRDHGLATPRPGWAEQDPDEVVDVALATVRDVGEVARERGIDVAGLATSTPMHSLVGFDRDGRPATAMVTWADTRAATDAQRLRDDHLDVYHRTGTPLHPMSPLATLCWFARHGVPEGVVHWGGLKDHLLQRLTGAMVVDASSASATGLFDLRGGRWDDGALALAGITADQLSVVVDTTHVVDGGLTPEAARATGLPRGLPVVAGATDGAVANLGVGALRPGLGAVTIGTSGAVRVTVDEPRTDDEMRTFCYALAPGRWVVGGAINNGGLWLRWLRESVLQDDTTDEDLSGLADTIAPGADGVLVLPYLTGERAPQWSSDPSATIFGLRLHHGRGHLVRAGLEGVAHQLRLVTEATGDVVADRGGVRHLRATGGFTHSDVWLHIVADVLGVPLHLPRVQESAAFGVAVLGMVALGLLDDLDDVDDLVEVERVVDPDPGRGDVHDLAHARYVDLLTRLDVPFREASATRRR